MTIVQRFGEFLLRNPWQAGLVALLFSAAPLFDVPFVAWIGIVIVGFITLGQGWRDGVIVLVGSSMVPLIFGLYDGNYILLVSQVLLGSLLVFVLAYVLAKTVSWQLLLELSVWVAVLCVLLAHWILGDLHGFWLKEITAFFKSFKATAQVDMLATLSPTLLVWFSRIMTGCIAAWVLMGALINVGFARWWQSTLVNPGGLRRELLSLRLSITIGMALLLSLVAAKLGVLLCWDLVPIFMLCLFAGGLSIACSYVYKMVPRKKIVGLVLLCLVTIIVPLYAVTVLAALAMIDSVVDVRKRFKE